MSICCVMLYDENRRKVGEVASELLAKYCHRHGYLHRIHTKLPDPSRNASWNKIPTVKQALIASGADTVFFWDADVFVIDPQEPLPKLKRFALFSQDSLGYCAGFWGVSNTSWSRGFLDSWWFLGRVNTGGRDRWEQDTLHHMLVFDGIRSVIDPIPDSIIANPESILDKAPLAWHGWANRGEDAVLRDYEALKQRWP